MRMCYVCAHLLRDLLNVLMPQIVKWSSGYAVTSMGGISLRSPPCWLFSCQNIL